MLLRAVIDRCSAYFEQQAGGVLRGRYREPFAADLRPYADLCAY